MGAPLHKRPLHKRPSYLERHFYNFSWRISIIYGEGAYGALHKRPLRKGPHQNQAIAQKLGILGEKVTSMTGLRIQKYLLGPI